MTQSSKIIRSPAGVYERGRWAPHSAISRWVVTVWWALQCKPLAAWPFYSCLQTCLGIPAVLSLFKCLHTCTFIACVCQFLSFCTVSLSPLQVHPWGPVWPLSLLRREGASRSMLSSAFLFGPWERKGHGTSFLSLSSLCLQHFSTSWEQSQDLQSVQSPGRPLTIVPAVTLGSQAVGSTLMSISGL